MNQGRHYIHTDRIDQQQHVVKLNIKMLKHFMLKSWLSKATFGCLSNKATANPGQAE